MSTISSIKMASEPIKTLAFGSILAGYLGIGTGLAHPARIIRLVNLTNLYSICGSTR